MAVLILWEASGHIYQAEGNNTLKDDFKMQTQNGL